MTSHDFELIIVSETAGMVGTLIGLALGNWLRSKLTSRKPR